MVSACFVCFVLCVPRFCPDVIVGRNKGGFSHRPRCRRESQEFIGVPYRYGQMNPKRGFDCSGFTTYVFKSLDICLTRSSRSQFREGVKIDDRRDLQQGDLVFFTGTRSKKTIGHVGIVTDVDEETGEFEFIHAGRKGICINSSSDGYYDRRYVGACRVLG